MSQRDLHPTTSGSVQVAVRDAIAAPMWSCDDGHRHRRPERFTMRRLQTEVNRRNPRNPWYSSVIACAIYDLIESGELIHDIHGAFDLRVAT